MQEESGKWSCSTCTYLNYPTAIRCTMCREPRNRSSKSGYFDDSDDEDFDFFNDSLMEEHRDNNCDPVSTRNIDIESQKWPCQMCTYLNWPRATKCVQCLTLRFSAACVESPSSASTIDQHSSDPSLQLKNLKISSSTEDYSSSSSSCQWRKEGTSMDLMDTGASNLIYPDDYKWMCSVCTFANWPKAQICVICGALPDHAIHQSSKDEQRQTIEDENVADEDVDISSNIRLRPTPNAASCILSDFIASQQASNSLGFDQQPPTNLDYERRMRVLRRRMREQDSCTWLAACMGVVEGDMNPIEAYLNAGGDPARKLTSQEISWLGRSHIYEPGHTLVHLAFKYQRQEILTRLFSHYKSSSVREHGVKRVPGYVAPDLASAIRRHITLSLRQRKGHFPCFYFTEWATFALPSEIEELPPAVQERLFRELLDRDAQTELESEALVINWVPEDALAKMNARLHALWNRSAGDCLLDAVLQATWGVFDRDNTLRRAMSDSLHEAGHVFYPRWKEWEKSQALEMDFCLNESQLEEDWRSLLNLASQPGSSLEQVHVFCLAHVLRRPIIVYGVKYVKSWKGENLGYARFEGVYLPLLWESSFCSRSPIALGYTRGHFSALVPPEPANLLNCAGASARPPLSQAIGENRAAFLPLVNEERNLLPVHFLTRSEVGREEELLREWMEVGVANLGGDDKILVARQRLNPPPLMVAQMIEEWMNHYKKITYNPPVSVSSSVASTNQSGPKSSSLLGAQGVADSESSLHSKPSSSMETNIPVEEEGFSSAEDDTDEDEDE